MSTKAEALRTCIAVLTAQLAIEEGKPATAYLPAFDSDAAEKQRLEEIANRQKPHAWADWSHDNPLPEDVGTGEKESPLWESAKPFWAQMERQTPFVFDDFGQRFNAVACLRRGGVPDFERNVKRLWAGADGDAYRAAKENDGIWQRIKV